MSVDKIFFSLEGLHIIICTLLNFIASFRLFISDNMDSIGYVKHVVLSELSNMQSTDVKMFTEWVKSGQFEKDLHNFQIQNKPIGKLRKIAKDLKACLPFEGILPTENVFDPSIGPNSDCIKNHTMHVDEFIYNDLDVEKLRSKGSIQNKYYCSNCDSTDVKETVLISHSLDGTKLQYIFTVLLPCDLSDLKILDIGSRTGAVLYGAFYWTNCNNINGIEINNEFCDMQKELVYKYHMDERVNIIQSDILLAGDEVLQSDVIIMNNVFEFFMPVDLQVAAWRFLRAHLKHGGYVVTIPSVEESLDALGIYEEFISWLEKVPPCQMENMVNFDMTDSQFGEIYFYKIK